MILESLYLILPGALANMAPVLFKRVGFLNYPVDFNRRWRGKPIFGKNKTYRGFFFGVLLAVLVVYIQRYLLNVNSFRVISLLDYSSNTFMIGFLIGFGVLFGDLVKSFFKRRFDIKPGASWFPFDQLDALVGGLLFMSLVYVPPLNVVVTLLVIALALHPTVNYAGYLLGTKKNKW